MEYHVRKGLTVVIWVQNGPFEAPQGLGVPIVPKLPRVNPSSGMYPTSSYVGHPAFQGGFQGSLPPESSSPPPYGPKPNHRHCHHDPTPLQPQCQFSVGLNGMIGRTADGTPSFRTPARFGTTEALRALPERSMLQRVHECC